MSADLRSHAAGFFAEAALRALAAIGSEKFELLAYHNDIVEDAVSARIRSACAKWTPIVGMPDAELAGRIRTDRIDVLLDLSGHTAGNRLAMFACKPAPVQATWLGYFATTGVKEIDYLIGDRWTTPPGDDWHFTETLWRLPHTRLCFTVPDERIDPGPLPALANGFVTFGCFNTLSKVNADVVAVWARVLRRVAGSRLYLKARQLTDDLSRAEIVERFAAHGVANDRLILEGPSSRAEYLEAYKRVDITLDPFPYPGGATSAESLWMAVPVLTLGGDRLLARQGVGLLMNAGLPEFVANDRDHYVESAALHAGDLPRLAELRQTLRPLVSVSPVFDASLLAHDLGEALRGMWRHWCSRG